jgi:nicotinamidase-related amidase
MNALIVIGMPTGHWCVTEEPLLQAHVAPINRLIAKARDAGWMVIFAASRVREWHQKWDNGEIDRWPKGKKVDEPWMELPKDESHPWNPPIIHCLCAAAGNPGCTPGDAHMQEFHHDLDIREHDYVIGFRAELQKLIRDYNVNNIYYSGAHSAECVCREPYGMYYMAPLMKGRIFFFSEATLALHPDRAAVNAYINENIAPAVAIEEIFGCQRNITLKTP